MDWLLLLQSFVVLLQGARAIPLAPGLVDPAEQPLFHEAAPNALDPSYIYESSSYYNISMGVNHNHMTGLMHNDQKLKTTIFGYGMDGEYLWPGKTIVVTSAKAGGPETIMVEWHNELYTDHILPVDTSLHWAYSLHGYQEYSIANDGIPVVPHLHGGRSDSQYDGNPEFFFSPGNRIVGPQWDNVPGGFTNVFVYNNDIDAATMWYHDHSLGITRLNVYAGLAAFYFVRDELDSGRPDNHLGLPTGDQELAYAIQDRLFSEDGSLFYPAFPGDPFYGDFIEGEGAELPEDLFPNGGPSALAEFFGDIMLVNGKIWPKADVDPREYRIHLLNGCDSRYLVIDFVMVAAGATSVEGGTPLQYTIIGSDGGLGTPDLRSSPLVLEPGARYDLVINMAQAKGSRVIMRNLAGDAPFGGDFGNAVAEEDLFDDRRTDRVMAFDVSNGTRVASQLDVSRFPGYEGVPAKNAKRREVALFEGLDEFGRLQPLLGAKAEGSDGGSGLFPAYTWSNPTTEFPEVDQVEEWYILNFSADAHPIHLHLVDFEIVGDFTFLYEVDGDQIIEQHNGSTGKAPKITSVSEFTRIGRGDEYYDAAPKDSVVVNPGNPDEGIGRGSSIRVIFRKRAAMFGIVIFWLMRTTR